LNGNNNKKNINTQDSSPSVRDKTKKGGEVIGIMRAVPVVLIAISLFLTLCYITADTGAFGKFISNVLMGLFSYMAYTIPFFIAMHALFYFSDVKRGSLLKRFIFSVSALVMLAMTAYVIATFKTGFTFNVSEFYKNGTNSVGGGVIGSVFAFLLMKIFGRIGLIIILSLALIVYVIYLASGGGSAVSDFFLRKIRRLVNYGASLEKKREEKKKRKSEGKEAKQRAFDDKKNRDLYNDEYFGTDNGVSRLEIPELGILETKNTFGTAHILRETVIKNTDEENTDTENDTEDDIKDAYKRSKFNDIFVDVEASFVRTDNNDGKFKSDDIIYEAKSVENDFPEEDDAKYSSSVNAARAYGIDDSADAIFTQDFDPYDLAMNEKRRDKASSKADAERKTPVGFSEYIASMTKEDSEHLKKLEEFETKGASYIDRKTESSSASTEKTVSVESTAKENEGDTENDALKQAEAARLAEQALLANYGYQATADAKKEPVKQTEPKSEEKKPEESFNERNASSYKNEYERKYGSQLSNSINSDKFRFVNNTVEETRIPYSANSPTHQNSEPSSTRYNVNQSQYSAPQAQPQYSAPQAQPQYSAPQSQPQYSAPQTQPQYSAPQSQPQYNAPQSQPQYSAPQAQPQYSAPQAQPQYSAPQTQPQYNAPQSQPQYSTTVQLEANNNLKFIEDDGDDVKNIPITANSTEFRFDTNDTEEDEPESRFDQLKENDNDVIEVSRSMLENDFENPETEEKVGLDFSTDEDIEEDGFTEADAEEPVQPTLIPEEERNPDVDSYRNMFTIFDGENEDASSDSDDKAYGLEGADEAPATEVSDSEIDDAPFDVDEPDDIDELDDIDDEPPFEAPAKKPEKPKAPKIDYSNYKFPPLDLLKKSPEEDWDTINREIQYGGEQLINTLDSFNIKATIRGMEHGPRITRYSIVPAKGIRVNQIEKLADDIALALAAESIRIEAPIPGKSAVGVEVPNKVSSLVTLRDLLESDEFMNEPSKTSVCIGKSVEGSLVYGDIGSMPHALIAGATGMGKSVCINALITSILYKARPDEVKFIMIDPKKVEFAPYTGLPHLLIPVVTDPKQAAGALMWAVDEMNKRYEIIEQVRVKNIDSYNRKVAENPELGAPMSKIIIFIDELNDLMVQVRDPVENLIMLLAQKSRAAGIHLVIGTQRPSVDVLTGVIKANIPTRIACKVSSGIDSRTILEKTGAEKLIGKGDMLFAIPGKEPKRVQGAFVSDGETEAIVEFIKSQVKGEVYDEQALEDIKRAAQKCDKSKNGDDGFDDDDDEGSGVGYLQDRKFLNAVELAVRNGSVATSFLQRKLHIGYGKAAQYIDIMEDLGVVGEKNGSKARDVLISMDEWNEKLSRLTDY